MLTGHGGHKLDVGARKKIHAIGPENRLINDEYSSINKTKFSERERPRSEVRVNLGCEARPALRNAEY